LQKKNTQKNGSSKILQKKSNKMEALKFRKKMQKNGPIFFLHNRAQFLVKISKGCKIFVEMGQTKRE